MKMRLATDSSGEGAMQYALLFHQLFARCNDVIQYDAYLMVMTWFENSLNEFLFLKIRYLRIDCVRFSQTLNFNMKKRHPHKPRHSGEKLKNGK